MNNIFLFVIISITLLFCNCSNNQNNSIKILSTYEDGKKNIIIKKINDSVFVYISYFQDGSIMDSLPYLWGRQNGLAREYSVDPVSGPVKLYTEYKMCQPNGHQSAFYLSGEKRWECNYSGFDRTGECKYYYKDGNISAYIYYDSFGKERYVRKYNRAGDSLQETGDIFVEAINQYETGWIFKPGDSMHMKIVIATPPDLKIQAYISEINRKLEFLNPLKTEIINNLITKKDIAPLEKGEYYCAIHIQITNKDGQIRKLKRYFVIWVR